MTSRAVSFTLAAGAGAVVSALILAACGGGGGGGAMPPPPQPSPSPSVACNFPAFHSSATKMLSGFALRAAPREPSGRDDIVPGLVAVRFASRNNPQQLASAAARLGGAVQNQLSELGSATIRLARGADPIAAAATLRGMPGVVAAGPVLKRYMLASQTIPNDPEFGTLPYDVTNPASSNPVIQWDMYKVNMPSAWALATGFGSSTVKVAIIDTGFDSGNMDLKPNGTRIAMSVVYDLGTGSPHGSASPQDGDGHGTDVSGIAAADTNNGTDIAGVAGGVTLLEARVFPTPSASNPNPTASTVDVAAAINWAVAHGAKVINMSLGSSTADPVNEEPAVAAAIAAGVTVVAAAGNSGTAGLDFPAGDPGVIAVGASALCDSAGARDYATSFEYVAGYSQYVLNPAAGEYYVVAPGGDPSSAQGSCSVNACIDYLQWITNLYSNTARQFPGELVLIAGTSQASPHVAGLAALMLSKNPALTPAQIGQIISANTTNIADAKQGHGRVDALAALNATP